ncbi:hypothetical protein ACFXPA_48670 [Amycolatopsis sp. NPDC059090]|uniref:hypothetical protein n=1 Tax=unclassified Amycolatopsis TaxID=2618356 RepID=UPI00366C371D
MNCAHCGQPIPAGSRRDRRYCHKNCRQLAYVARRFAGSAPLPRWRHPALESDNLQIQAAADLAEQLGAAHGWSSSTIRCTIDGLEVVLDGRSPGERVRLTEVRSRTSRQTSSARVAEVLSGLGLLEDDTVPPIRSWIDRRASTLASGFASDVRAWLLVLLDGDDRTRPRSHSCLYAYFGAVQPFLATWADTRGQLREITSADVAAALDPLLGWRRRNAIAALRSLFRFAKKRGVIFADPTTRLKALDVERGLLPMTDAEVRDVENLAVAPRQHLAIALAAVHAARATAIRRLTLDDLDMPNRRITIDGHTQRLGELAHRTLNAWLEHRRLRWPHTPNRHLLVSEKTALGTGPVSRDYLKRCLLHHGVRLEQIRGDRILQEALAVGADPLHLSLVFDLSHSTASRYADIARQILAEDLEEQADER